MKPVIYYLTICLFLLTSCNNFNKGERESIPVLDIKQGLNNLTKMNLTDFKSNIRYVRLETNKNCLVTNTIRNIYVEENKIFIRDNDPFLKVFDANTGKYLYNVGSKGQGPGELPSLRHVDMNVKEKRVIFGWAKVYKYDFEGNYLSNIELPKIPAKESDDIISDNVVILDTDLYSVGAYSVAEHQLNAVYIFNEQANIINTLKSYDDYIQHHTIKTNSNYDQLGFYYKCEGRIHFYRGICDTVYAYDSSIRAFKPSFCFDFGKHRRSRHYESIDTENKDEISVKTICENDQFVFMDLSTKKASTEPFMDKNVRGDGKLVEFLNHSVYALYDKQSMIFSFLLQPVKGIMGFANAIDNGLPFWPKYISSKNEFVDIIQAFDFIEYADKLPKPDNSFREISESMDEEDNPIVIIAY